MKLEDTPGTVLTVNLSGRLSQAGNSGAHNLAERPGSDKPGAVAMEYYWTRDPANCKYPEPFLESGFRLADLFPGNHGFNKVLIMQPTGNNHSGNMQKNQQQHKI